MKKYILILCSLFLLFPNLAIGEEGGEAKNTFEIQGEIGDFAAEARIYEVDGKIYEFDEDILIQTQDGTPLTFADLKGGMSIKIIAEKSFDADGKEKIKYIQIIVKKKKLKVR